MFKLFEYPENWDEIRKKVYRKDGWTCQRCGIRNVKLHAHHLIPLSEGGLGEIENLVTLCERCHKDMHFGMKYGGILALIMMVGGFLSIITSAFFFVGLAIILCVSIFGIGETIKARRELLEKFRKI